jgi:hypothetical protein
MKNILRTVGLFLLVGPFVAFGGAGDVAAQHSAVTSPNYTQYFTLTNVASGLCLDGFPGMGPNPYTNTCSGPNNYQQWFFANNQICNVGTGLCLDGDVSVPGEPYLQSSYPTDVYQQWSNIPDPRNQSAVSIHNSANGACLDGYTGGPSGAYVYLNTCFPGDDYQMWILFTPVT